MANTKISAEVALTASALNPSVDVIPIVSIAAGPTGNRNITPYVLQQGSPATDSIAGSMSAADKTKLDSITVANLLTTNTAQTITGLKTVQLINIPVSSPSPTPPASGSINFYTSNIGGRTFLISQTPDSRETISQTSLARNSVSVFYPTNGSTIGSYGQNPLIVSGSTSHIQPSSDTVPLMVNMTSASVTNTNVSPQTTFISTGVSTNSRLWCRGTSSTGFGGYFYFARILFPDSSYTNTRFFAGMYTWLPASISKGWYDGYTTSTDTPDGNFSGFSYSTYRGDTSFQFITKDGTTQNTTAITGVTLTPNVLYDFILYCPRAGSAISYQINNLTAGTTFTGSTTSNLPSATTYMSAGFQLSSTSAGATNIQFNKVYCE